MKTFVKRVFAMGIFILCCPYSFTQIQFNKADSVIDFLTGVWTWEKYCGGWSGCTTEFEYPRRFNFIRINGTEDSLTLQSFNGDTLNFAMNYNVSYLPVRMYNNLYYWTLFGDYYSWTIEFYDADTIRMKTIADDGLDIFLSRGGSTLAVDKVYGEKIAFFPNPCRDFLEIKSEGIHINQVIIYNDKGQVVLNSGYTYTNSGFITMSNLLQGIYFIQAIADNGIYIGKILKE